MGNNNSTYFSNPSRISRFTRSRSNEDPYQLRDYDEDDHFGVSPVFKRESSLFSTKRDRSLSEQLPASTKRDRGLSEQVTSNASSEFLNTPISENSKEKEIKKERSSSWKTHNTKDEDNEVKEEE